MLVEGWNVSDKRVIKPKRSILQLNNFSYSQYKDEYF